MDRYTSSSRRRSQEHRDRTRSPAVSQRRQKHHDYSPQRYHQSHRRESYHHERSRSPLRHVDVRGDRCLTARRSRHQSDDSVVHEPRKSSAMQECRRKSVPNLSTEIVSSIIKSLLRDVILNDSVELLNPSDQMSSYSEVLRQRLLDQGVPESVFGQPDDYHKMSLVFSGRISKVAGKDLEEADILAGKMISACKKTFGDYASFFRDYVEARIAEIENRRRICDDDVFACPPMMDYRRNLHNRLSTAIGGKKHTFRYSEIVDLSMYYFNHIADKSWLRDGGEKWSFAKL